MEEETKNLVLKKIDNLRYSLKEIWEIFYKTEKVTPDIMDEIEDAVEEWGKILNAFKKDEVREIDVNILNAHINSVTYFMYQLFDNSKKGWITSVSKSLSSLERFKLVFRTEEPLVEAERTSLFSPGMATGTRITPQPVPPEFLKFSVFRDNPTAFTYYAKLVEIGEIATLRQISEAMGVSTSNTSLIMNKLFKDGFISKNKDKNTGEMIYRIKRKIDAVADTD